MITAVLVKERKTDRLVVTVGKVVALLLQNVLVLLLVVSNDIVGTVAFFDDGVGENPLEVELEELGLKDEVDVGWAVVSIVVMVDGVNVGSVQ